MEYGKCYIPANRIQLCYSIHYTVTNSTRIHCKYEQNMSKGTHICHKLLILIFERIHTQIWVNNLSKWDCTLVSACVYTRQIHHLRHMSFTSLSNYNSSKLHFVYVTSDCTNGDAK